MNKKIYIIVSFTGTLLSRIIKLWTRKKYSHVSISLDDKLDEMYSFGRVYAYNPFIGSFVHENPKWGTFKRFKNTKAVIFTMEVTEEEYNRICEEIDIFKEKKYRFYKFNYMGVVCAAFNKVRKKDRCFYCSEFVKHVLDKANVKHNLSNPPRPMDFLNIPDIEFIYEGKLREYI